MKTVLILMAVYAVAVAVKTLWGRKLRRIRILRDLDLSFKGFLSALGVAVLIAALVTGGTLGQELLTSVSGLEEDTLAVEEPLNTETELQAAETASVAAPEATDAAPAPAATGKATGMEQESGGVAAVQTEAAAATESETAQAAVSVPASQYADGTYTGTGYGFKSEITVAVAIASGNVTNVTVTDQRDDRKWFERAYAGVVRQILAAQSAEVDTVSGATYSSQGIIDAAAEALDAARAAARQVTQ